MGGGLSFNFADSSNAPGYEDAVDDGAATAE